MADLKNLPFFLVFANESPNWKLISCAFILGVIAIIGIVLNFSVIYVTIRTKSINGTANYLLALCSFFEILHQFGHFLFVYVAFSGQNLIEYRLAAKFVLIPSFGYGAIYIAMLFTGVDRLIVLIFGEMNNKHKIRLYLAIVTIISVFFGCFSTISLYQDAQRHGDLMITGCTVDFFMFTSKFRIIIYLLILIMTLIIYLLVGMVIKFKSAGLPSANSINQRVFRALCSIITVNVGGYLICMIFVDLIKHLISSPITAWFGQVITLIFLNIGAASNGPILYFTSKDYRQAFRHKFPIIFKQNNLNVIHVSPQQNKTIFAPTATAEHHRNL